MSTADTARVYYSSIRLELNVHIRLRDQALFLFLGAVGVLFGIAYSTPPTIEILLIVPFLGLGAAFIVAQHDSAIVTIASYCNHEIDKSLKDESEWVTPWDKSESMRGFEHRVIISRFWAHLLIILLPVVVSLSINSSHALKSPFPLGVAWWFGLVSSCISIYVIADSALYRRSLYEKYPKE